jgi:hypothetical protein
MIPRMTEQTSAKHEDGKGIPPSGEGKTAETSTGDSRLFPGGSADAADTPVGMSGLDKEEQRTDERVVDGTKSTS